MRSMLPSPKNKQLAISNPGFSSYLFMLFLLALLITVIAIKQIDIYENETQTHDNSEIVIDELAGMWIALAICGINSENVLDLERKF